MVYQNCSIKFNEFEQNIRDLKLLLDELHYLCFKGLTVSGRRNMNNIINPDYEKSSCILRCKCGDTWSLQQ